MNKRDLFTELHSALNEAKAHSQDKLTLKTYTATTPAKTNLSPEDIVRIREQFNMSRGVFARLLRTSSRTLENWEQGRSTPNEQAATLLKLVEHYPQTLDYIAELQ